MRNKGTSGRWARGAGIGILFAVAFRPAMAAPAAEAPGPIFGQPSKALPGDVRKYSWPRRDLRVTIGTTKIAPALALGSWAAFHGSAAQTMAMGDLAQHDLLGETPRVVYVHFMGHGEEAMLARTLSGALEKTRTPRESAVSANPSADETKVLDAFQAALGRKGTMTGTVLQISVPRSDPITDGGMEIPASMGIAESINVQTSGSQVATTGDFVLVADEVNPVIRELEAHGIDVTALHSHMLRESPRLFFLHFWATGPAEKVGEGLKAALSKIATK